MKNILILLFATFCYGNVHAQKIRYTDPGNHWTSLGLTPNLDGVPFVRFISFLDTTTVNGLVYRRMFDRSSGVSPDSSYLVREDTTTGIVYSLCTNPLLQNYDTVEHILFNYNLNLGDTVHNRNNYDHYIDSVMYVDSTIINGVYHKVWGFKRIADSLSLPGTIFYMKYSYIEGVGSCTGPHYPFNYCFEGAESLVCFNQQVLLDTMYVPVQTVYINCGGLDSINTVSGCASLLSISNINKFDPVLSAYPNPGNDQINIQINTTISENIYASLYDMQGRCIYHSEISKSGISSINTTSLLEGVYLLLVQTENGILKKEKIVIQR